MPVEPEQPTVYAIAGPNGAGKTTFATTFLPGFVNCREFVNADLIAAGLSPFDPDSQAVTAGRLMLQRSTHWFRKGSPLVSRRRGQAGFMRLDWLA